ncbi:MAG: hypothetical protein ACKVYV_11335 [Limisphaerales bacterium]
MRIAVSSSPRRGEAAFTMVEIALALAVVAFALVAIIGVLPTGLQVQRDNRQETVINQEGEYLLNAIRSGADRLGVLSNAVYFISVSNRESSRRWVNTSSNANQRLTGDQIVGLLSTPKVWHDPDARFPLTNRVVAWLRAMNSTAIERDPAAAEVAFRYRAQIEIVPLLVYPPALTNRWGTNQALQLSYLRNLQGDLPQLADAHEIRLTLSWPIWADDPQQPQNLRVGNRRRTFRSLVPGTLRPWAGDGPVGAPYVTNLLGQRALLWRLAPNQF